jgi:hypothetical protein
MDRISRLMTGLLLGALIAFWVTPARAQFSPPPTSTWTVQNFMGSPPYGGQPTVAAFCGPGWGQAGYLNGGNCEAYCRNESPSSPPLTTTERNTGRFFSVGGNSGNTYTFNCGIPSTACPANSTLSGSTCTCNSGYQVGADGQSCTQADACSAADLGDTVAGPYTSDPSTGPAVTYTCGDGVTTGTQANCLVQHTRTMTARDGAGQYHVWRTSRRIAGPNCTASGSGATPTAPAPGASAPAPNEPVPEPCPARQCRGTVNGNSVCMPCSQTSTPNTTTTQNGSGTTTGTSTTSTTCTGGSCTTTTQTRDGSGTLTGTTTTTTTYGQHCAANPGAPQCNGGSSTGTGGDGDGEGGEGSSSFGGSCSAGFSCEGDAVQCAIARDQHIRACQFYDTTTDLSTIGANAVSAAASQPAGHPGASPETVDLSLSDRINQTPLFGGTTCPSDVSATIMGQSITVPFSDMCGYLNLMGTAGVLAALLAAAMIVFRTNG